MNAKLVFNAILLAAAMAAILLAPAETWAQKGKKPGGGGGGGGYTFVTLDDRPGANLTRSGVNDVQETNGSFFCVGYLDGIADLQAVVWEVIPSGSSYAVTTHFLADGQGATAINAYGEIVGGSDASLYGGLYWPDRNSNPLPLPPLNGENKTRASGINSAGIIVGESIDSVNEETPVAWRAVVVNNVVQIEGPFALGDSGGGSGEANDINQCDASGLAQVVGWSYPEGPVLWEVDCLSPTLASTGPVPLVPPNQMSYSPAYAINDAGDVCGRKDGFAFRYLAPDGEIQYLSTHSQAFSRGQDINTIRQVVGRVDLYSGNYGVSLYGTLWQADGSRVYLNSFLKRTSEWKQIDECTSITDSGAIGGRGRLKASFPDNNLQALLMIPK